MRICIDCLVAERPKWFERYVAGWYLLLVYAGVAFFLLKDGVGLMAQALFFLVVFPWIVWPLVAATRAGRRR
jgi:hypothetical protein